MSVEKDGAWKRFTCPNLFGNALYTAMARVPRAVGMIVVCREAAALINTTPIRITAPQDPSNGSAITVNMSSAFFGLPRPDRPVPA